MSLANIAGWARPVRIAANSSLAYSIASAILVSASRMMSAITGQLLLSGRRLQRPKLTGETAVRQAWTVVPIFSPATTRTMVPSVSRLKKIIGSL